MTGSPTCWSWTTTPSSRAASSALFEEFTRRIGSSLLIGSAHHKNTNAKAERVNGALLRAFATGRKDDWDVWLPQAVFAIKNAAF